MTEILNTDRLLNEREVMIERVRRVCLALSEELNKAKRMRYIRYLRRSKR